MQWPTDDKLPSLEPTQNIGQSRGLLCMCYFLYLFSRILQLPYFSGYKPHFFPPQINYESGVCLIRGHRHLEISSGYRLRPHHTKLVVTTFYPVLENRKTGCGRGRTSNCRTGRILNRLKVLEHPSRPSQSEPVHEVLKQIVNSCYYLHSVRTPFEPVLATFSRM